MKVRHQLGVVAVCASMLLGGFPSSSVAQLVRGANTSAPMLVVVTFKSNDRKLGVDFAENVRDRVSGDVSYRDLQVQSKQNIDATLQASGYDMTAALTEGDANLLAKQLRADEYIEGTIDKAASGNGFTATAWMVLTFSQDQVQPLGTFEGKSVGDVASQISKAYQAAHKIFDEVKNCRGATRESKYNDAMTVSAAGIVKYPKSTLLRICEMSAMVSLKKPAADILRVAGEILALDPKSKVALQAEVDAYDQLADADRADTAKVTADRNKKIETLSQLLAADPGNTKLQQTVVYELAQSGKYDVALKIIQKAVADNPGDVVLEKLYWQLLYATKDFKTMVKIGDEMIKLDTSFADTTYFDRTIDAYRTDSAYSKAAEVAAHATQKYPRRAEYWAQRGQLELKAGQTKQAVTSLKRALELDPKLTGARMLIITSLLEANEYDSVIVAIREAKAAGEDANTLGGIAITVGTHYFRVVNDTSHKENKTIPNLQRVLSYVTYGDSLTTDRAAKNNAKFLMGLSHYFIATLMINDIQAQKDCEGSKRLQDILIDASSELPVGGASNPDLVRQLMPVVQQLASTADQMIKVYCAPPKKPDEVKKKP